MALPVAAQEIAARQADWKQNQTAIMARINDYIAHKDWRKANLLAKDYLIVAADVMRPIIKDTKINELREVLAKAKPNDHETRVQTLRELAVLDRGNPKWDAQLAAARKSSEAADRAKRRKEGVHIGMSMDDARMSSWGRPRRVNRTTTAAGETEQWVYDGGYLYFSNGVLTAIQN